MEKLNKKIFGIVLLTLLCNPVLGQTYEPTKVVLDYDQSSVQGTVYPGDKGIMNIVVRNIGDLDAERVEVQIPTVGDIRVAKKWYVGTLAAGDSWSISTTFDVRKNASTGTHTTTVYIRYDGYDRQGRADNNQRDTYEFNINVEGSTIFVIESIKTSELKIEPGDTFTATLAIRNDGIAEAKNMELMLYSSTLDLSSLAMASPEALQMAQYSITPVEGINVLGAEKQFIGDLRPGETKNVSFIMHLDDDLEPKAYSLPFMVFYEDSSRQTHGEIMYAGMLVTGETKISVSVSETDPDEIHAGDEDVEIKVKVDNTGTESLENVKISYQPQHPFRNSKSYMQVKDLGSLSSSGSVEESFYADVEEDAVPGQVEQVFLVEYEVGNNIESMTVNIPLEVLEYPDLDVETAGINATISMFNEMRLTVRNSGSKCDSVTVWALKKSEQPFDFQDKSQFIGDLDKGESGVAVLGFTVEGDAKETEYILPVEIRCTLDDDVVTFSDTVRINVRNGSKSFMDTCIIAGFIILVLAAALIYSRRSKKEGKKK